MRVELGKGKIYFWLFPSSQRYKVDRAISHLIGHGGCPELATVAEVDLSYVSSLRSSFSAPALLLISPSSLFTLLRDGSEQLTVLGILIFMVESTAMTTSTQLLRG